MSEHDGASPRTDSGSADAVVIGAGVIGSAVTLELARRGLRTICVDKLPTAGYGSTSSSSAIVRFNYSTPAGVALAWEGAHYWKNWSAHIGDLSSLGDEVGALVEFTEVPMVAFLSADDPPMRARPHFDQFGLPYTELDLADLLDRYPYLDPRRFGPPATLDDSDAGFWGEPDTRFAGAIEMLGGGYVSDPQLAAQNLAAAARVAGAEFRFNTTVSGFDVDENTNAVRAVQLDGGASIATTIVVNVAGPHSSKINEMARATRDMGVTTRALRREVFVVPAPVGVDFGGAGFMSGDIDLGVYYRPEAGNNVLIGSAEPDCDELEWIDDPDHYRMSMTEDEYQLLVLRTSRRLTGLPVPQTKRGLVDLYDATPDWTPIYDRSSVGGFYMACGTSGNQFKNAAVAGYCMAELIDAVEGGRDHDADPLIVQGRFTGNPIDLGTFSRLRRPSDESATSVLG